MLGSIMFPIKGGKNFFSPSEKIPCLHNEELNEVQFKCLKEVMDNALKDIKRSRSACELMYHSTRVRQTGDTSPLQLTQYSSEVYSCLPVAEKHNMAYLHCCVDPERVAKIPQLFNHMLPITVMHCAATYVNRQAERDDPAQGTLSDLNMSFPVQFSFYENCDGTISYIFNVVNMIAAIGLPVHRGLFKYLSLVCCLKTIKRLMAYLDCATSAFDGVFCANGTVGWLINTCTTSATIYNRDASLADIVTINNALCNQCCPMDLDKIMGSTLIEPFHINHILSNIDVNTWVDRFNEKMGHFANDAMRVELSFDL